MNLFVVGSITFMDPLEWSWESALECFTHISVTSLKLLTWSRWTWLLTRWYARLTKSARAQQQCEYFQNIHFCTSAVSDIRPNHTFSLFTHNNVFYYVCTLVEIILTSDFSSLFIFVIVDFSIKIKHSRYNAMGKIAISLYHCCRILRFTNELINM